MKAAAQKAVDDRGGGSETRRGEVELYVRNWRDNAHEVQLNRWMITSVDGQRYEIEDVEALDARSKALLDQLA